MQAEENKTFVRRFFDEVQTQGQLERIDDYVAEDFVDHSALPGFESTREGVRQLFAALRNAFPDLRVTVHDQVADDERVVSRKSFTGTHRGEFMGLPPTGNAVEFEVIDILRIVDGRITDHWVVGEFHRLMQQVGAAPATAS